MLCVGLAIRYYLRVRCGVNTFRIIRCGSQKEFVDFAGEGSATLIAVRGRLSMERFAEISV